MSLISGMECRCPNYRNSNIINNNSNNNSINNNESGCPWTGKFSDFHSYKEW